MNAVSLGPLPRLNTPLLLFALTVAGLLLAAVVGFLSLRDASRAEAEADLRAIGDSKQGQMEYWLNQQRADAEYVGKGSPLAGLFTAWQNGKDARAESKMLRQFEILRKAYGYEGIMLFDLAGHYRFGGGPLRDEHAYGKEAIEALRQGGAVLVDLHFHRGERTKILVGMMAPLILDDDAGGRAVGEVLLVMDAEQTLFPLLRRWPLPSQTGETVLVRMDGDQVRVLLTRKAAPLSVLIPLSSPDSPSVRAVLGERGILKGSRNYLGALVLAHVSAIEGTPWMLIAKQDQGEVDAPVQRLVSWILSTTLLLLFGIALGYWLWWRSESSRYQARILAKELERATWEQHFGAVTRYANDAVLISDARGQILDCNERSAELYGYPRDELLGQSLTVLCPAEEQHAFHSRLHDLLTGEERQIFEANHRHRDGSTFPVEVRAAVTEVLGIQHLHLIIRDISERKQIEAALQQAHVRFRCMVDANMVGIVIANVRGAVLQANDYYLNLLGVTHQAFAAGEVDWREMTPPEWLQTDDKALAELLERGVCTPYEKEYLRKDGTRAAVFLAHAMLPGPDQEIISICIDTTELKRNEAALYASKQINRATFDKAPIGIAHVGTDGSWIHVNDKLCEIVGYSREELLELSFHDITHPDDLDLDFMRRMLANELETYSIEKRYIRKDRSLVWINLTVSLVRHASGEPDHFISLVEDISLRKEAEERMAHYQENLEVEVHRRTAELETANQDLENFSYSVSHDLRAPLRAIDGFVGILLEEYAPRLDAEGLRLFGVVQDNARKMGQLIDDILAFSRAGRLELTLVEVDMNALVDEVWNSLSEPGGEQRVEFSRGDLLPVQADPRALRQVWQNLLANARKFSRGRQLARIEVSAAREDSQITYTVTDNGAGFNPKYSAKLFGLFQRLHGMDEFEGTGVGLAIVKRYIQKHGGSVAAAGTMNGGARFSFTLPAQP